MIPDLPRVVLGTAQLGLDGDRRDCFRLLDAYFDLGGRIIDTAAVYSGWVPGEDRRSESIIGEWRSARAASRRPFICTKGGHPSLSDMKTSRLDRRSLVADVEDSLRALRMDCLDLFYLHRDDETLPVEDILAPLAELMAAGKIAHVGLSNWRPERVAAARRASILPIASNQVLGNILCRHMDAKPDPTIVTLTGACIADAQDHNSSLMLFSSQAGGTLSKIGDGRGISREYSNQPSQAAAARIRAIAERLNVEPTNLAVAFLLAVSPNVFPVVGCRSVEQVVSSMAARDIAIPPEEEAALLAISGFADWGVGSIGR